MIGLDDGGSRRRCARAGPPEPDLRDLVEQICVLDNVAARAGRAGRPTLRVVPDVAPHLIYHVPERGAGRVRVVGLRTRHADIDVSGRRSSIVVRLRPWALPLLGIDARALVDRGADAADLGIVRAERWNRRLAAVDDEERGRLLQELLRRQRRRHSRRSSRVRDVVRAWQATPGERVGDLVAASGVPARTLRARFRRELGMGPKRFSRIARLLRSLERALATESPDWLQLALTAGYCDQSHLVNEWGRLLGESPVRFLARG